MVLALTAVSFYMVTLLLVLLLLLLRCLQDMEGHVLGAIQVPGLGYGEDCIVGVIMSASFRDRKTPCCCVILRLCTLNMTEAVSPGQLPLTN